MRKFLLFIFLLCHVASESNGEDDVLEGVEKSGYVGSSHDVDTEDGYILKLHHIAPSRNITSEYPRQPILLVHGLSATAFDYIATGPRKALAYLLADNGYEVFMGNVRGSKHSMRHRNFSVESQEFWNFSFHEIGCYDIAAMIDYILHETNATQLFYVGHSQGTTSFLALMSDRPEYQKKILQGHLLAPAVILSNMPSPVVKFIAERADGQLLNNYAYMNLVPFYNFITALRSLRCPENSWKQDFCPELIFIYFQLFGRNAFNLELDLKVAREVEMHGSPRIGIKQVAHFSQLITSRKFQKFDYKENNTRAYSSSEPPEYNLSTVKVPIFIYAAKEDALVSVKDASHLKSMLPNVAYFEVLKNYNHADVLYGGNSRLKFYTTIVKFMNNKGGVLHD